MSIATPKHPAASNTVTSNDPPPGPDGGIQIGANGSMTATPPAEDPTLAKEAKDLKDSKSYVVEPIGDASMADGLAEAGTGYQGAADTTKSLDERQSAATVLLGGVVTILTRTAEVLGAMYTEPVGTGSTPAYNNLADAADSAADGVEQFPVATHNAHADAGELRQKAWWLRNLLALSDDLARIDARVGLTTLPLARDLSGAIKQVCLAATPELVRSPALARTLAMALNYNGANAAKAAKTKVKTQAVKDKIGKTGSGQGGGQSSGGATSKGQAG